MKNFSWAGSTPATSGSCSSTSRPSTTRSRRNVDEATIGVLLVADRDETVVQYALQASTAPVAVSRYELPEGVRANLPAD